MRKSFTAKLVVALLVGLAAAVVLAPFVAVAVARLGFRFPFPRIFDRVVMIALALVLSFWAQNLKLVSLLRAGFARPVANFAFTARGLLVALGVMVVLFLVASAMEGFPSAGRAAGLLPKYVLSAALIAVIEEAFFRAFLFGGMKDDFGSTGALIVSSTIYALAHLVRAPGRFYATTLDLSAGVRTLGLSFSQLSAPLSALPTLIGLFLLGVVLAEAFILTGTVWFSVGLHAGFVIGAKLWPKMMVTRRELPGWLAGWGKQPLISGAAAWVAALAVLLVLRALAGTRRERAA
ncbi:MAG TPA: CPBP family intramembrane glutamic endopeptidase [Candidatus Binataceae bacterium]|nr:CPBP family intramembrane glutamic endopeptidase [Candidatus Binataceae bacterium]